MFTFNHFLLFTSFEKYLDYLPINDIHNLPLAYVVVYERFALIHWLLIHSTVQSSSGLVLPPFDEDSSLFCCVTNIHRIPVG